MVLDGGVANQAAWPLLQAGLPAASLTLCGSGEHSSCLGNGINHSKFYLLSALDDGSTDVVVQSSANLTREMLRQHNNLVVVRGDSSLYQGYLDVWHDQRAQVQDLDYYRTVVGDGPVRSYFFPRASGDTVVSVLHHVVCSAGSRVRVAMSLFTDCRIDIAAALDERAREGCDVQVLLKHNDTMPGAEVLSLLQESEVSLALLRASDARATVHSKVLLIDSAYDTGSGASWRRLVFTGSHNWTGPALRANDEQLMRIDDGEVFAAFEANLDAIAATAP